MTGIARHPAVLMSQLGRLDASVAPGAAILLNRLGEARFLAVVRITRRNRVEYLHDFPLLIFVEHRALEQLIVLPVEAPLAPGRAQHLQSRASGRRGNARRSEVGPLLNRAVTIHAIHFDRVSRLSVELAVAMVVLNKVAVDAVHSLVQMDVCQMHRLSELVRIVEGNDVALGVQEPALTVVFVYGAEDPSMTVKIGELRVLQILLNSGVPVCSRKSTFDQRPRIAVRSGFLVCICCCSVGLG
jgi:hypothetical protein